MGRLCMLLLLAGVCLAHSKEGALFQRTRRDHITRRNTPVMRRPVGRKAVEPFHARAMLEESDQHDHGEEKAAGVVGAREVNADGPDRPEQTEEGPVVKNDDTEEHQVEATAEVEEDLEDVEEEFDAPDDTTKGQEEERGAFLRVRNYDDRYFHRPDVVMEPHRSPAPMESGVSGAHDNDNSNSDTAAAAGTADPAPGVVTPQGSDSESMRAGHHHHGHHNHHHHDDDEDEDMQGHDHNGGGGGGHEDWDEYEDDEEQDEYDESEAEYYDRYEDGHRPWWFEGHRPNNATLPSESILSTHYTLRQSYEAEGPVVKMYCPSGPIHYNESLQCWYVITNTFSFALQDVTFQVSISDGAKKVKSPITIPSVAWDHQFVGGFDVPLLQPGKSWVIQVWVWCTAKRGGGSVVQRATLNAPDEPLPNGDFSYGNLPATIQVVGKIDVASGPGPEYPYERPNEWGINDPNWRPKDDGEYHEISYPHNPLNPPPLGTDPLAWSSTYATGDDDTSGTIGDGDASLNPPPPDTPPSTPTAPGAAGFPPATPTTSPPSTPAAPDASVAPKPPNAPPPPSTPANPATATPSTPTTPAASSSAPTTPTILAPPSVPPAAPVPVAGTGTAHSFPVDSASNLTHAIMPLIGHAVTAPAHALTPPAASGNTTNTTNSTAYPPKVAGTAAVSPSPLNTPKSPSNATDRNGTTAAAPPAAAGKSTSSAGKHTRRGRRRVTLAKSNRRGVGAPMRG